MDLTIRVCRWLVSSWNPHHPAPDAEGDVRPPDLADIRQSMMVLLACCSDEHQARGAGKIARARSAIDLWLLRMDLYQYLAQDIGQSQAAAKVAELLPLFRDAVPMAASGRKNPDNRRHG